MGGLSSAIGDAILHLVQFVWPSAAPQFGHVARNLADAVKPDPPFKITGEDGELITGILVVDRGRVLFFVGTRQPAVSRSAHTAAERTYPEPGYAERPYDADQSLWSPRPYTR